MTRISPSRNALLSEAAGKETSEMTAYPFSSVPGISIMKIVIFITDRFRYRTHRAVCTVVRAISLASKQASAIAISNGLA
ncbi:hypothetical protein G6F40_016833 [Rhizopus arrhizus]|nr:hypothetical protein G6F40_016833 [Rhizopus arrhizus]